MKTRAAVLYETNKPLVVEEIEIPKLKKGQVLVRILATGVCRAQVNERKALKGPDRFLPHLLGHEGAGEVVDTGGGVSKIKKKDYVVCTWIKGKGLEGGESIYEIKNQKSKIKINAGSITTFSEYAVVSENRLVKISREVPPDVASILGCAIPTGVGIVRNTLKVHRGSTIGIFGTGGVGSASILGAKMIGCETIVAVDITKEKLDFAKHLGATHTIKVKIQKSIRSTSSGQEVKSTSKNSKVVIDQIREIVPRGLDYAVEAAGVKEAMETAFEVLNDHGRLAIAGNLRKGEKICIVPYDLIKGKQMIGTWGGESRVDIDIPYYAEKYLSRELEVEKLISKKYSLDKVNEALDMIVGNRSLGRVIIES